MKKIIVLTLTFIMSFSCFSIASFAKTAETKEHLTEVPEGYIGVFTVEDLYRVRNDLTANYILMNDIDLAKVTAEGGDYDYAGGGWRPIGSREFYGSQSFGGIFDGNGYSITEMRIEVNSSPAVYDGLVCFGLFSFVSGTVRNLTITGEISSSISYDGTIWAGGIAGGSSGTIENCISNVAISVANYYSGKSYQIKSGGIVGQNDGGSISKCCNLNDIYSYADKGYYYYGSNYVHSYSGGICGVSYGGKIDCSYNAGKITGKNGGSYARSYATGICYATGNSGKITIINCYNTGDIVASVSSSVILTGAAGIVYCSDSFGGALISNCYNIGTVNSDHYSYSYGISSYSSKNCYYLSDTGVDSTGATPLTQDEMQLELMYSDWDFDIVWTIDGREDYPYPELRDVPLFLQEDFIHKHEHNSEVTKEATHLEEGETTYTCVCGDTYTEAIAKLEEHSYTSEVTTDPTHLTEGVKTFTCACGDSYTEAISKLTGHTYKEVVTEPTCTAKGYTTYTCECGDSYIGDYVGTKAHSYNSTVTRPATHLTEGVRTYTCSACGDSYTEAIAKTKEHSYFVLNIVEPTCEAEGYTTYMCECGHTYNGDKKASTGHNYNGDTCVDCGESKTENCSCNCHKSGFMGIIWKILRFFYKLFGTNKTCGCGVAHY